MAYLSDIEIAQSTKMQPITEIAKIAGVDEEYLEQYGKYKAKVDYALLKNSKRKNGKLVLVTAIILTSSFLRPNFSQASSTFSFIFSKLDLMLTYIPSDLF